MLIANYLLALANALALAPFAGARSTATSTSSGLEICPWSKQRPLLSTCLGDLQTNLDLEKQQREYQEDEEGWIGPLKCTKKWCLWTNRHFAGGRGISVITPAENMAHIKSIGRKFNGTNPLDANPSPPPYKVDEVPGKGLGVLANKTISRGTVFMTYSAVLLVHKEFVDTPTTQHKRRMLDQAIEMLPDDTRQRFDQQMSDWGGGGHRITAILLTNSFQMGIPTMDGHHYGNFPEVSRLNHNCRPNSAFYLDERLTHRVTAVQKIKKGEEITISYVDPVAPRFERRKRSEKAWGFSCDCDVCSQHDLLVQMSDSRLAEIKEIEDMLEDYESDGVTVKMIERLIKLYKLEKLNSRMFGAYTLASLNYNMLGWDRMAVKYAKMAIETGTIESGPDAPDVIAMGILADDPKGHFTWKARLKPR